jgi:exopolyphosphatase/guanosine-5'-triphosphate,3'-diphosphate pyrophosphatase
MRDAGGGDAVRAHVKARFGVEARTISGDEEARLTFSGALSGLSLPERVVVFDIGGGSTEVVDGDQSSRAIRFARSFDVGSVRLTERHVRHDPPTSDERAAVAQAAAEAFASVPQSVRGATVIGIAGTVTTLAAVSLGMTTYDASRVHGLTMELGELERVVATLAAVPLEERTKIPGLEPKRADVIVAGGLIALAFLRHVGAPSVVVSDRGVRWGLAEQLAAPSLSRGRFRLARAPFSLQTPTSRMASVYPKGGTGRERERAETGGDGARLRARAGIAGRKFRPLGRYPDSAGSTNYLTGVGSWSYSTPA